MPEYLLAERNNGGSYLKIDESEFEEYSRQAKRLRILWEIEESFELVVRSFMELEETLLKICIEDYYTGPTAHTMDFFGSARNQVNLRLNALLGVSRSYENQVEHRCASSLPSFGTNTFDVHSEFQRAHSESFDYRLVHALRNYAVHEALPVKFVSYSQSNQFEGDRFENGVPSRIRVTINPTIGADDLTSARKINAKVKDEIGKLGVKEFDVKFIVRGFVSKVAEVHLRVRDLTSGILEGALSKLDDARARLIAVKGSTPRHLVAVSKEGEFSRNYTLIDPEHFQTLVRAREQWTLLKYCQRGFASSEVVRTKDTYPVDHPSILVPK